MVEGGGGDGEEGGGVGGGEGGVRVLLCMDLGLGGLLSFGGLTIPCSDFWFGNKNLCNFLIQPSCASMYAQIYNYHRPQTPMHAPTIKSLSLEIPHHLQPDRFTDASPYSPYSETC